MRSGVLPPLETDDSTKKSDHLVTFLGAELPRFEAYEVLTYSYRLYTEEDADRFYAWIVTHDWSRVMSAGGSNAKAEQYQMEINRAMDCFFPVRTTTRKSTDLPWVNASVRKRIKQRRGIFMREGRSKKWKRMKQVTNRMISRRRKVYMDSQRMVLLEDDSCLLYTSDAADE